MSKIAIFASGQGSNAGQILRFLKQKESSVQVAAMISNKTSAGVYEVAEEYSVPIYHFSNTDFTTGEKIVALLEENEIGWIVLAGFLRKIEGKLLESYHNKIINLHPSLLPKFGGKGMYGNHVHQAVIESDEEESGISIHLVNQEFDKGKILFQAKCRLEKGQTVVELAQKIQKLEHSFFPKVIEETVQQSEVK